MTMKLRFLLTAVLAGACLLGVASLATAGSYLECYKGKDSTGAKHKYSGGVLASNTGLLTESGCIISTPPKICCDAVDAIGFIDENSMPPPGAGPAGLTTRFCCYKVAKCTGASTSFSAMDDFGAHTFAIKKPGLVCAPVPGPTTTTVTTTTTSTTTTTVMNFNGCTAAGGACGSCGFGSCAPL